MNDLEARIAREIGSLVLQIIQKNAQIDELAAKVAELEKKITA